MTSPEPIARLRKSALAGAPSATFVWRDAAGREREGFVVRHEDGYRAYENSCPHLGTPLDWGDGQFFEEEGRFLVCSTHGALFRPADGFCVGGPCANDYLPRLAVREEGDDLLITEN